MDFALRWTKICSIVWFLFSVSSSFAQSPGWVSPNPAAFTFSTNVTAKVTFDGSNVASTADTVAFFVGGQLRGLAVPTALGSAVFQMATVFSNSAMDTMEIRWYHTATNKVYVAQNKLIFIAQTPIGDFDLPFEVLVFSSGDAPVGLDSIPAECTLMDIPFDSIRLIDYLVQPDGSGVTWTTAPNADLVVTRIDSVLKVSPRSGFVGSTNLVVRVTEQTANAYFAERSIQFNVLPRPARPGWDSIPGQGILKGTVFQAFNLADYENKHQGSCLEFDYRPVMVAADPLAPQPAWTVSGTFLTSMTIIASPVYTPGYVFNHPNDRLAAFIDGQLRGVVGPQVQTNGKISFFLLIGSDQPSGEITLQFYSGALGRTFTAHQRISYVAAATQGSADTPLEVDFSPLRPTIGMSGAVQMQIRDTSWRGELDFYFIARDCSLPCISSASLPLLESGTYAPFCITSNANDLYTYYKDIDGDGFGDTTKVQIICDPVAPVDYVTNLLDCDDGDDAINPAPSVAATQDQTLCHTASTTAINFVRGSSGVNSPSSNTIYRWTNNNTAIGLAASGTGNIAAFEALNINNVRDTARIIVTPEINGCRGSKDTFLIIVKPRPNVVATADQVLCHNQTTTAVSFTGQVAQTLFSWNNNNTDIGLAASGTGNIGAFNIIDLKTVRDTGRVIVVPSADGCTGIADTFLLIGKPVPSVQFSVNPFSCKDSVFTVTSSVQGGLPPYKTYSWGQFPGLNPGSVQITNNMDGTATIKGGIPGDVFLIFNVVDSAGCSALTDASDDLRILDCSKLEVTNKNVPFNIGDPCICKANGAFDETVWVEPTAPGQVWTVVAIGPFIAGGTAPQGIAADSLLKPFQQTPSMHIHKIDFVHLDSAGFVVTVEGPNPVGSEGNVRLSIDNVCYYPDLTLQGLPPVVSPNSPAFDIVGSRLNLPPLTGAVGERDSFLLNGQVLYTGQNPPSKLTLRPAMLQPGVNTLRYGYNAGAPGDSILTDPGCYVAMERQFELASCGCTNEVRVTLDRNSCGYALKPSEVVSGNCTNATVRVIDKNPLNKDTIDCAGIWTYGLFDGLGNLICWGKVTAEDKSAPLLTAVYGRCNRLVAAATSPSPPNSINPETLVWRDTFLCTDVHSIFNEPKSWDPNAGYRYYAGSPRFHDACDYNTSCDCRSDVRVNDQLLYYQCSSVKVDQVWAKITRTFIATDCNGNRTTVVQEILLVRPNIQTNVLPSELVIRGGICSSGDTALIKAFLSGDYPDVYRGTPQPKYIFDDPYSCSPAKYAYFANAVAAGKASKTLECNYSFDWILLGGYEVCNDGFKMEVIIKSADWCTGISTPLDTVWLKWIDDEPPTITVSEKPIVISTGPASCNARFGIDTLGLKDYFGVEVKDGCGPVDLNVEVWSCTDSLNGEFIVGGKGWRKNPYPVKRENNGRIMLEEVPIGRHYLYITANDRCYNKTEKWVAFSVVDRIAPSPQCKDKLQVSISNTRLGNGAVAVFAGYARVSTSELLSGVGENCRLDWVRLRRALPIADGTTDRVAKPIEDYLIALGYDSDKNGRITTNDGFDWNKDGQVKAEDFEMFVVESGKLYSPMLDWAEFFCSDTGINQAASVEVWARDKMVNISDSCGTIQVPGRPAAPGFAGANPHPLTSGGNMNMCWATILLEDKIAPTFLLPRDVEIPCTERALNDALSLSRTLELSSPEYQFIEDNAFFTRDKGRFEILTGAECIPLTGTVTIKPELKCGAGKVTLTYTVRKKIKEGDTVVYNAGSAVINIRLVHQYNLAFPADETTNCTPRNDTANVVDGGELSCDVLAVLVQDKRYAGASGTAECYKIFRTFTVINWCQYEEKCGEPQRWAVVVPRDPDGNGTSGASGGVNVLVRDQFGGDIAGGRQNILSPGTGLRTGEGYDGWEEIYYEDATKDLIPQAGEWISIRGTGARQLQYNNTFQVPCPQFNDRNTGNEHFAWTFTQYIFVHDAERPRVVVPGPLPFYTDKNTCTAQVRFEFSAQDNCSATEVQQTDGPAIERVRIRLNTGPFVELGNQGTITPGHLLSGDNKGNGRWEFSGPALPEGNHALEVVVRDDCGNLSEVAEIRFSVSDTNAVAPICVNGLSTTLLASVGSNVASVALRAGDFVASPIYDCNGQGPETNAEGKKLIREYYIVKDVNGDKKWGPEDGLNEKGIPLLPSDTVQFTCADLGGDSVKNLAVRLYSKDLRGNWAWCESFVTLKDPLLVCKGFSNKVAQISGSITTASTAMAPGVEVELSGSTKMKHVTDNKGVFMFPNVLQGYDYSIIPQLDRDYLNGISTLDLIALTRHILGSQTFSTPYQYIAADINNSRSITTLDMIQLRKLILGLDSRFPNNTSWRFVDASHKFSKPNNPWATPFSEVININDLSVNVEANFIAVKIGDLNASAGTAPQIRSDAALNIDVKDHTIEAGREYRIPFHALLQGVEGYQFSLSYDKDILELVDLEYGIADKNHFGLFPADGLITTSWNQPYLAVSGETHLFTMVVRAKSDHPTLMHLLAVNSRLTRAEAYRTNGELLQVALQVQPEVPTVTQALLYQNVPNPFAGETIIGFDLPWPGEVRLTVSDIQGRVLKVLKGNFGVGYGQFRLKDNGLPAGILQYTLTSGQFSATRRMAVKP